MADSPSAAFGVNAADRILGLSRERLIAFSRLILAAGALAAIYIDPSQPAHAAGFAYAVLALFLVFSLVALIVAFRSASDPAWNLASHLFDITLISLIIINTEGPTSPYFVLFTYVLFSGTLRWEWRGAIATGAILSVVLIVLVVVSEAIGASERSEFDRLLMRVVYLLVVSCLFAYVGAYLRRSRERLVRLASWPAPGLVTGDDPDLCRSLAHAAAVLGAARVIVIWDREDEPYRYLAHWTEGRCEHSRKPPDAFGTLVASDLATAAFIFEVATGRIIRPGKVQPVVNAVDPELIKAFFITDVVTAAFAGPVCSGRVLFLETSYRNEAHVRLAEVVAYRIGLELDHHVLLTQLQRAVRADERGRLARDLHDGTLQCLAAVGLQLQALSARASPESRQMLGSLQRMLSDEQRRIRSFVETMRPSAAPGAFALASRLQEHLERNRRLWGCTFQLSVEPPSASVSWHLGHEIELLLDEAIANAVQHGRASRVHVGAELADGQLSLSVWNDGHPLKGLSGVFDHAELEAHNSGPVSLRARVARLNGALSLSSLSDGVALQIHLPAHERAA
jgi:signal transduction histidine kinase